MLHLKQDIYLVQRNASQEERVVLETPKGSLLEVWILRSRFTHSINIFVVILSFRPRELLICVV
jgi:hypothetical protein